MRELHHYRVLLLTYAIESRGGRHDQRIIKNVSAGPCRRAWTEVCPMKEVTGDLHDIIHAYWTAEY